MSSAEVNLTTEIGMYAARLIRRIRRDLELTAGTRVLSILDESGPTGVSQLARADQCSQPTMSGTVNQLVERGLVAKEPDPADARGTLVLLTDQGKAQLAHDRAALGSHLARLLDQAGRHDSAELRTTAAVLRTLVETA